MDSGVFIQQDAYMTCPYCKSKKVFISEMENTITQLVMDGNHEEAKDMNTIYNLLKTSPVLAVLEAEYQNRNVKFIDSIRQVFDVKKLQ